MAEAEQDREEREGLLGMLRRGNESAQHHGAVLAQESLFGLLGLSAQQPPPNNDPENQPGDLEAGNGGANNEAPLDLAALPEEPGLARWSESTLPFLVLLLIVFCSHHLIGIMCFIWLTSVLHRCNVTLKQQATLWEMRSVRKVLDVVASLTLNLVGIHVVFRESNLWHRLLFLPPTVSDGDFTVWMALWTVITNDILLRFMAMLVKCVVLLSCGLRSTSPSRRRQIFTLIESCSCVYRTLTPVPVWYFYFFTGTGGSGTIFASMLAGLYLAMKLASITERLKFLTFVMGSFMRGDAIYGKYATAEDLEAGAEDCSICQGPMRNSIVLPCTHLFCEECVSEWLEREPTCPLCRAQVTPGRMHGHGDGSTSLLPQVF